jgi:tetratricopeptide (TPR) repeat protein
MGVVYEAEQQHPHRPVALKVIRGGRLVDPKLVRMFQREAETLARLRHPGIAAIYESGSTEEGQHFFAMELVRGESLTEHAARRPPPPAGAAGWVRERLALFRKICDAVNYAHQRAVIHRDLKPGNVFILRAPPSGDASAVPDVKILDFGLARITDSDIALSTMLSEVGAVRGTLPYMSPEQVRGNPDELDLRTDLYSLGVILYELLTGKLPCDLRGKSFPEAARMICEDPPLPLHRAWTGPGRLDRDLQTIVQKTLEKDPAHRYQSAGALSDDVERYLTDQPILARPASLTYQLRKIVARHRAPFGLAAALVMLLVGSSVAMLVQARRVAREAERAEREAAAARQVSEFLEGLFEVADPGEARGNTITAREILDVGAARIGRELADQPLLQAQLLATMGRVYRSLGLYDQAEPILERALESRRAVLGDGTLEAAASLHDLAGLRELRGEFDAAASLARQALEIRTGRLGPDSAEAARSLQLLGSVAMQRGELDEAAALLDRALAMQAQVLGPGHLDLAWTRYYLGGVRSLQGRASDAEGLLNAALEVFQKELGPDHIAIAWCLNDLGNVQIVRGDVPLAADSHRRSLEMKERLLGPDHPDVALSSNNYAYTLILSGRYQEAEALLERALPHYEVAVSPEHPATADMLHSLGELRRRTGALGEARGLLERSVRIQERSSGPDHPNLAEALHSLGLVLRDLGEQREAEVALRRALAIREKLPGPGSRHLAETLEEYAVLLRQMDRPAEAAPLEERARSLRAGSAPAAVSP